MLGKIALLTFIIIAFILRFWQLSDIPPSLSHDEVAIGYNAWSILQTGKDEYGTNFPMLFRSFDDYKLPGYIYMTSLSEKIFGLNEFSVRFPSAFLGSLTILILYFLVKELFAERGIALFASFLLATNPWHINFSRAAFEANGSLFFIVLGALLLFKGLKNPKFFIISFISFAISIYFYYTARILVPVLILVFIIICKNKILAVKKWVLFSFLIFFVILLPLLPFALTTGLSRINQVSIFEDKSLTNPYSEAIVRNNNSVFSKIAFNRRLAYFQEFSENYLKNFAPDFYFVNGTGPTGLLYIWEFPFFFYGIYIIFRTQKKWKWILLTWFLLVPVVGGLTTGQPNALRTLANAPIAVLFSSIGVYGLYLLVRKNKFFKIYIISFFVIISFFFFRFMMLYFNYYPSLTAINWGDGHKQMAKFVNKNKNEYDHIYITGDYWRPYIYYLFYSQYPPSEYQKNGSINNIDNIYFGKAGWDNGAGIQLVNEDLSRLIKGKTFFILSSSDFANQKNLIKTQKVKYDLVVLETINGKLAKESFHAVKLR